MGNLSGVLAGLEAYRTLANRALARSGHLRYDPRRLGVRPLGSRAGHGSGLGSRLTLTQRAVTVSAAGCAPSPDIAVTGDAGVVELTLPACLIGVVDTGHLGLQCSPGEPAGLQQMGILKPPLRFVRRPCSSGSHLPAAAPDPVP